MTGSSVHRMRSSGDPGLPHSSLAPKKAAAALLLPPPMPACAGILFRSCARKKRCTPLIFRKRLNARMTRLDSSTGTPGKLHSRRSLSADSGSNSNSRVSPNATAWKRDARSWYPSGRLRTMRRNRLILAGEKSSSFLPSWIPASSARSAVLAEASRRLGSQARLPLRELRAATAPTTTPQATLQAPGTAKFLCRRDRVEVVKPAQDWPRQRWLSLPRLAAG
mmetsp:Transcript_26616/g.58453  ORF Transcript_26616/g.58453 Transcript_26616/m.58453 type:complete len:222 (-) Transcript_26616:107-772(-)